MKTKGISFYEIPFCFIWNIESTFLLEMLSLSVTRIASVCSAQDATGGVCFTKP